MRKSGGNAFIESPQSVAAAAVNAKDFRTICDGHFMRETKWRLNPAAGQCKFNFCP